MKKVNRSHTVNDRKDIVYCMPSPMSIIINKLGCLELSTIEEPPWIRSGQIHKYGKIGHIHFLLDNWVALYSCSPPPHSYHRWFQKKKRWSISTTCSGLLVWGCSVRLGFFIYRGCCSSFFFSVGATSLFSLIVIILSGLVTSFSDDVFNVFFDFAALGIATGLLTLLTLPAMFVQCTPFFLRWKNDSDVTPNLGLLFPWFAKALSHLWSLLKSVGFVSVNYLVLSRSQLISNMTSCQGSSGSCGLLLLAIQQVVLPS